MDLSYFRFVVLIASKIRPVDTVILDLTTVALIRGIYTYLLTLHYEGAAFVPPLTITFLRVSCIKTLLDMCWEYVFLLFELPISRVVFI